MQQSIRQTLTRGAMHDAPKMLEIVKSYTRYDLVCAIEKYRILAGAACATDVQAQGPSSR